MAPSNLTSAGLPFNATVIDATTDQNSTRLVNWLGKRNSRCATGLSNVSYMDLHAVATQSHALANGDTVSGAFLLGSLINHIALGSASMINATNWALLRANSAVLVPKDDSGGVRPIGIGEAVMQTFGALTKLNITTADIDATLVGPPNVLQLGLNVSGGCEAAAHVIRYLAHTNHGYITVSCDQSNAFNMPHRADIREAIQHNATALSYFDARYGGDGGWAVFSADYRIWVSRGVAQGDVCSSLFFDLFYSRLLNTVGKAYPTVHIVSIHDDTTVTGPRRDVFQAISFLQQLMVPRGMAFNLRKFRVLALGDRDADTTIAARAAERQQANAELDSNTTVEERTDGDDALFSGPATYPFALNTNGLEDIHTLQSHFLGGAPFDISSHGITIGGLPVGSSPYETAAGMALAHDIGVACHLVTQAAATDAGVSLQDLNNLLRFCISTKTDYFARGVCPDNSTPGLAEADGHVQKAFFQLVDWHDIVPNDVALNLGLPFRRGGLALGNSTATAHGKFASSFFLTGPTIARVDAQLDDRARRYENGDRGVWTEHPGLNNALASCVSSLVTSPNAPTDVNKLKNVMAKFPSIVQTGFSSTVSDAIYLTQEKIVNSSKLAAAAATGSHCSFTFWVGGKSKESTVLWTNTSPLLRFKLTNTQWATAARLRVGLPLVDLPDGNSTCPVCGDTYTADLLHALSCRYNVAQRKCRHDIIEGVLVTAFRTLRTLTVRPEVAVGAHFTHVPGEKYRRADIVVTPMNPGLAEEAAKRFKFTHLPFKNVTLVELTFTNPAPSDKIAGARARRRATVKYDFYSDAYVGVNKDNLWVIVAESSGLLDQSSTDGLYRLVNTVAGRGENTDTYTANIRLVLAASLQRSNMEMINNYKTILLLDPNITCRKCQSPKAACDAARERPGVDLCPGEKRGRAARADDHADDSDTAHYSDTAPELEEGA